MEDLIALVSNPAFAKLLTAGTSLYQANAANKALSAQTKALKQNTRQNAELFNDEKERKKRLRDLDFTIGLD